MFMFVLISYILFCDFFASAVMGVIFEKIENEKCESLEIKSC